MQLSSLFPDGFILKRGRVLDNSGRGACRAPGELTMRWDCSLSYANVPCKCFQLQLAQSLNWTLIARERLATHWHRETSAPRAFPHPDIRRELQCFAYATSDRTCARLCIHLRRL